MINTKQPGYKNANDKKQKVLCPIYKDCGGCQYLHLTYEEQLAVKQKQLETLLKPFGKPEPIIGMKNPWHYRNKVHAVFSYDRKGKPTSGVYQEGTHRVLPVDSCLIEDEIADKIIVSVRNLLQSFKIKVYNEDSGYGLFRHVLVKRGFATGEVMVVLVLASPVFPSRNNFVSALRKLHPEITTIIHNVNGRGTSMILGDQEKVIYGKGYIEDILCGHTFRISAKSFYQVNPVQTEVLYTKAIEMAGLTGTERVLDTYCGIGTIGMIASHHAAEVIGVEQNKDAVRDAVRNAKQNQIKNIQFVCQDATVFMQQMAAEKERVDVVLMDPPRSGSTEVFIKAVADMGAERVVYVSCNPETLARDLKVFEKVGYEVKRIVGVDSFAWTGHVESVVLLFRVK